MNSDNFKVDALIIGAGRAGTTSMFEYLSANPMVNPSVIKEVHYFSLLPIFERGQNYLHSFFKTPETTAINLLSDTYLLADKCAPAKICEYNPKIKLIVILREPLSRAYSSYLYSKNNGYIKPSVTFSDSIKNENNYLNSNKISVINNYCHLYCSLYCKHLDYWHKYFNREQIIITSLHDILMNENDELNKINRFLNIPSDLSKSFERKNASFGSKSKFLYQILVNQDNYFRKTLAMIPGSGIRKTLFKSGIIQAINRINRKKEEAEEIPNKIIQDYSEYFKEDLQRLEEKYGVCLINEPR
jgi:hypothetical protein